MSQVGLFADPEPSPPAMSVKTHTERAAERERLETELLDWKGKAQRWAVALADERLKTARLWAIVKRLRARRSARGELI